MDGRGGYRKGAGRKRSAPYRKITINLPEDLLEKVDGLCRNRTQFIREAMMEKLERLQTERVECE